MKSDSAGMKRVAIFGVGLIGGSFALALRQAGFDGEILGVSSPKTIETALSLGVIDRGVDAEEAIERADLHLSRPTHLRDHRYSGVHRTAVLAE